MGKSPFMADRQVIKLSDSWPDPRHTFAFDFNVINDTKIKYMDIMTTNNIN
jgi:hypothetical protein